MSRFVRDFVSWNENSTVDDIECLLTRGMDVNFRVVDGKTMLHFAVLKRKFDVVKFLVENGAEIDVQDDNKYILIFLDK